MGNAIWILVSNIFLYLTLWIFRKVDFMKNIDLKRIRLSNSETYGYNII